MSAAAAMMFALVAARDAFRAMAIASDSGIMGFSSGDCAKRKTRRKRRVKGGVAGEYCDAGRQNLSAGWLKYVRLRTEPKNARRHGNKSFAAFLIWLVGAVQVKLPRARPIVREFSVGDPHEKFSCNLLRCRPLSFRNGHATVASFRSARIRDDDCAAHVCARI